jgi:hypothetical protein
MSPKDKKFFRTFYHINSTTQDKNNNLIGTQSIYRLLLLEKLFKKNQDCCFVFLEKREKRT